jgi:hypothetical protein
MLSGAIGVPACVRRGKRSAQETDEEVKGRPGSCARAAYSVAIFNSASTVLSHFSERWIIGPPWPSHSMLSTPS